MNNMIKGILTAAFSVLIVAGLLTAAVMGSFTPAAIILLVLGAAAFAAYCFMEKEKLMLMIKSPQARQGANSVFYAVTVIAAVVLVAAILTGNPKQFDLTKNKKYSLSEQTAGALKKLDKETEVYYFYSVTALNGRVMDLLKQYEKVNPKFKFFPVDADKNPGIARKFQVDRYGIVIISRPDINRTERIDNLTEEGITNGLIRISSNTRRKAYFTKGHGEASIEVAANDKSGYSAAASEMQKEGFDTLTTELFNLNEVPSDCSLLVVAGPQADFFPKETAMIKNYVEKGGSVLFLVGALTPADKINALLSEYGLVLSNNVVVDKISRMLGGDFLMPIISQYEQHAITKTFRVASFMPLSRTLVVKQQLPQGVNVSVLAKTNPGSWGETDLSGIKAGRASQDKNDEPGPSPVAAIIEAEGKGKIAVFGSSQFADNTYLSTSGNRDLFLNTAGYLAGGKDAVTIRAKENSFEPVFLSKVTGSLLFLIPTVLFPLLVIAAGIMVFIRRNAA